MSRRFWIVFLVGGVQAIGLWYIFNKILGVPKL